MTREEAINILKQYIDYNNPDVPDFYTMEEACEVVIKALEQEQCEDCISREKVSELLNEGWWKGIYPREAIMALPSVSPMPKMGRWIYDKNIDNWKCSECGETPKTMGYCGTVAFMAEHFKYCNHCGTKMGEVEE